MKNRVPLLLYICLIAYKSAAVADEASSAASVAVPPSTTADNGNDAACNDNKDPTNQTKSNHDDKRDLATTNDIDETESADPSFDDYEEEEDEGEEEGEEEEEHGELVEDEEYEVDGEVYYKIWDTSVYTLDDFSVAGVNLASYGKQPLFQLYEDFDISSYIRGDEDWHDILAYRNALDRPSLSFYVDKVARKRWLPVMGYPQPQVLWMSYAEEMTATGNLEEEIAMVHKLLPTTGSFCAKPTHMSLTKGAWLVDHQKDGTTRFSVRGLAVAEHEGRYNAKFVATKLGESLHEGPEEIESWALKNVKPGLVIEERWASHTDPNAPPDEFNLFVIWGRVWVGQWNTVQKENRWCDGFFYRNGTVAANSYHPADTPLPDWVPWGEMVDIAEKLGAKKDMFRVDMFVGRPAGAAAGTPMQIAVSESEIFPTTEFTDAELSREGARLWIAGYHMGIYEVVENTEVPPEFRESGKLSNVMEYRSKQK